MFNQALKRYMFYFFLFVISVVFLSYLPLQDPFLTNTDEAFSSPNWNHFLGTDELGRDIFSRMFFPPSGSDAL